MDRVRTVVRCAELADLVEYRRAIWAFD